MAVPHPAGARSLSVWVPDVIGWIMPLSCVSLAVRFFLFMDTQIMGEEYKCLRCEDTRLLPLDSPKSVQFFECPGCHRQYAHADGRTLTDRWLSPISLPLYRAQFYGHDAPRVAREFIEGFSGKQLAIIVADINDEIANPKQRVQHIFNQSHSEESLRTFLKLFADIVSERLRGSQRGNLFATRLSRFVRRVVERAEISLADTNDSVRRSRSPVGG